MTKSEQHKYIRAICTDETTKCALENANPDSIEFYLYKKVLEKNNYFLIFDHQFSAIFKNNKFLFTNAKKCNF